MAANAPAAATTAPQTSGAELSQWAADIQADARITTLEGTSPGGAPSGTGRDLVARVVLTSLRDPEHLPGLMAERALDLAGPLGQVTTKGVLREMSWLGARLIREGRDLKGSGSSDGWPILSRGYWLRKTALQDGSYMWSRMWSATTALAGRNTTN